MSALISTVIPAYNAEKTLRATVESVMADSPEDAEIIVVNDGSQDGTLALAESFGNRVIVLSIENDGFNGPGGAINAGARRASAAFVHNLDADDLVLPGYYAKFSGAIEKAQGSGADVAFVCCDAWDLDGVTGQRTRYRPSPEIETSTFLFRVFRGNPVISSSVTFCREKFLAMGGRRPHLEIVDDFDSWLRLSRLGELVHVAEALIEYRVDQGISADHQRTEMLVNHVISELRRQYGLADFFPQLQETDDMKTWFEAYSLMGQSLIQRNLLELAEQDLRTALDLNPWSLPHWQAFLQIKQKRAQIRQDLVQGYARSVQEATNYFPQDQVVQQHLQQFRAS